MIKEYMQYLKDKPEQLWFRRKLYGYGWVPVRWQGWLVVAIWLTLVLFFSLAIDENSPTPEVVFTFILPITLLTTALIRICYRFGEKPRWQWGAPRDKI